MFLFISYLPPLFYQKIVYVFKNEIFSDVGFIRFNRYVIQGQALDMTEENPFRRQKSAVGIYLGIGLGFFRHDGVKFLYAPV